MPPLQSGIATIIRAEKGAGGNARPTAAATASSESLGSNRTAELHRGGVAVAVERRGD